ncbi:MAG: PD40 domain-containing protein, partial [Candidatus Krumholzibacteriota bacterium]|nr:PD40 domain-containing protein [Candidatus Krumholzibacteriota bacterium]
NQDIYLLRVGGANPVNLTEDFDGDDFHAAFSRDGERIAFYSERDGGGLFVMGATGELPRRVSDTGFNPSWSPDGKQLLYTTENVSDPYARSTRSGIWVVDIASGDKRQLYEGDAVAAQWSPLGTRIAFWSVKEGQRDIETIAVDGGDPIAVTNDIETDWGPVWSGDGGTIYFVSDRGGYPNLWRVPIDEISGQTRGEPQAVTTGTAVIQSVSLAATGGRVAYTTFNMSGAVMRAPIDPASAALTGEPEVIFRSSNPVLQQDISPDGQWLTYRTTLPQEDIYVMRLDGTGRRQLTDDKHRDRGPRWSPDGTSIAFYSNRRGSYDIWQIRPDGTALRPLTDDPDLDFD